MHFQAHLRSHLGQIKATLEPLWASLSSFDQATFTLSVIGQIVRPVANFVDWVVVGAHCALDRISLAIGTVVESATICGVTMNTIRSSRTELLASYCCSGRRSRRWTRVRSCRCRLCSDSGSRFSRNITRETKVESLMKRVRSSITVASSKVIKVKNPCHPASISSCFHVVHLFSETLLVVVSHPLVAYHSVRRSLLRVKCRTRTGSLDEVADLIIRQEPGLPGEGSSIAGAPLRPPPVQSSQS